MSAQSKTELRKALRKARRKHVLAQPEAIKALLFSRPPGALLSRISETASIGLYAANPDEAPAAGYAKFFHEQGRTIALPRFDGRDSVMTFVRHADPYIDDLLEDGPFGVAQPRADAAPIIPEVVPIIPDVVFVPLIGFTENGERLGQGGGHYDRWLSEHPGRLAIGLAWDVQLCEALPVEPHDMTLDAIITPTRAYGL